jgi:hypothetical protein
MWLSMLSENSYKKSFFAHEDSSKLVLTSTKIYGLTLSSNSLCIVISHTVINLFWHLSEMNRCETLQNLTHFSILCLTLSNIVWWSASLYHKFHSCTLQMHSSLNNRHKVFTHHSSTVTEFHLCINLKSVFITVVHVWSNRIKISTEMNIVFNFLKSWSAFSIHLKVCFFVWESSLT